MELRAALERLSEPSTVTLQSSPHLAGQVRKKASKLDKERRERQQPPHVRKPQLAPVDKNEHKGAMSITPWELLHTLGRATVLSGQGSSRALSQHWSCPRHHHAPGQSPRSDGAV